MESLFGGTHYTNVSSHHDTGTVVLSDRLETTLCYPSQLFAIINKVSQGSLRAILQLFLFKVFPSDVRAGCTSRLHLMTLSTTPSHPFACVRRRARVHAKPPAAQVGSVGRKPAVSRIAMTSQWEPSVAEVSLKVYS